MNSKTEPLDIGQLLEDISYSMNQPEVDHLLSLIKEKEKTKAIDMLLENGNNEEEAEAVYDYFYKRNHQKYNLLEITPKSIPLEESERRYLVKNGTELVSCRVYHREGKFYFRMGFDQIYVNEAQQVWEIQEITE